MGRLRSFLHSTRLFWIFCGVVFATAGFFATILGVLDILRFDLEFFKNHNGLAIYLIIIHSILCGFVMLCYRLLIDFHDTKAIELISEETDTVLVNELISSLGLLLSAKKYAEVIRVGSALSRPFFVSGNYRARLNIGALVEEAAASINDERIQMIELIDAIGWMYVELGDLSNGEDNIRHGLKYALKLEDKFYISKANRHFGAICRRREKYDQAEKYYNTSLEIADEIEDARKKVEAIAGTKYAKSLLYLHTREFSKAYECINDSLSGFKEIEYQEKIIMASITMAQILYSQGKIQESKDLFRNYTREAEDRSLRLEMSRGYIGLTKIYLSEKNIIKAKEYLEKSEKVEQFIQTPSEISEIEILKTKVQKYT